MSKFSEVAATLQAEFAKRAASRNISAAAIAISHRGAEASYFAGKLALRGDVPVGPDSVFEIGSITKMWTATLIMQLVEQGRLDLDQEVRDVVPEFTTENSATSDVITFRHLLTHTGGFDGDNFTDTGEADDCLASYIKSLANTPQYFTPGSVFSYSNAGFSLLGRAVEEVVGTSFDEALTDRLIRPLGLTHAYASPADVPIDQLVIGQSPDEQEVVRGALPRSIAPAGSRLSMCVEDLLRFGQLHTGNVQRPGVINPETIRAMQTVQEVDVPDLANDWSPCRGLGWELTPTDRGTLVAHTGDTLGQHATLSIVPEADLVVAMITVGANSHELQQDIIPGVLHDLAGLDLPELPALSALHNTEVTAAITGTYSGAAAKITVREEPDGRVSMLREPLGEFAKIQRPSVLTLKHLRDRTYLTFDANGIFHSPCAFGAAEPRADYVHTGRAFPRTDNESETT